MSKTKTSRITNITLSNFRIHKHLNADTDKKIISIYGDNGSGKTTILEAVSLLASTKGMLEASVTDQDYNRDIKWTSGFGDINAGEEYNEYNDNNEYDKYSDDYDDELSQTGIDIDKMHNVEMLMDENESAQGGQSHILGNHKYSEAVGSINNDNDIHNKLNQRNQHSTRDTNNTNNISKAHSVQNINHSSHHAINETSGSAFNNVNADNNSSSGCGNHSVLLNINHAVEIKFERDSKVGKKRRVTINGKSVTKHGDIAKWCNVVWFTSGMQHEYISSSADRRKFFDRLVRYMFPEHSSLIYKYEELLKNRMKSLEARADDAWLKAIERKISQYGVEIVTNRSQTARMINDFVSEDASDLPKIHTELRGEIEDEFMKNGDTDELELFFAAKLRESRHRDLYSSRNNVGPHRVSVNIGFNGSFIGNFSSGQQKMMFISLINAVAKMVKRYFRIQPVMLIDEALSFLDEKNTRKLLDGVASDVSQVWLTSATKINTLATLQQCTKDEIGEISL